MSAQPTAEQLEGLGDRIRRARQRRGLTQGELAARIRVSRTSVAQWENGVTPTIKTKNLFALARVLNVPLHWITDGLNDAEIRQERRRYHLDEITDQERALILQLRALDKPSRDAVVHLVNTIADSGKS